MLWLYHYSSVIYYIRAINTYVNCLSVYCKDNIASRLSQRGTVSLQGDGQLSYRNLSSGETGKKGNCLEELTSGELCK